MEPRLFFRVRVDEAGYGDGLHCPSTISELVFINAEVLNSVKPNSGNLMNCLRIPTSFSNNLVSMMRPVDDNQAHAVPMLPTTTPPCFITVVRPFRCPNVLYSSTPGVV